MINDRSKKVGLFSFHAEYNIGTMLQAYALWRAIHDLGYESEYVSFSQGQSRKLDQKIILSLKLLFTDWRKLYRYLTYKNPFKYWDDPIFSSTKNEFDAFYNKYIPHTSIIYDPTKLVEETPLYENYIVGSDQTWSPYRYSDKNPFFLTFVADSRLKNSYAPSLGTSVIPDNLKDTYQNGLSNFHYLSCREKKGCAVLETITRKKVNYVLDPTLLIKAEQWKAVSAPYKIKNRYILCYILGAKKFIVEFAEKLALKKNLPVFYIVTSPFFLKQKNRLLGVGPSQFLSLINDAEYVCTDSYHGTLFAINYKKNFYSFTKRDGDVMTIDNCRIIDILSELSLLTQFKQDGDLAIEPDVDYDLIANELERQKELSMSYLKKILVNK